MGYALIILAFMFVGALAYCNYSWEVAKEELSDVAERSGTFTACVFRRMKEEPYANLARARELQKRCADDAGLTEEERKVLNIRP